MNKESSTSIYFISVASTLSGIHQQTIRSYEEKGLIKPYRTGGGTRRYSQNDIDKLIKLISKSKKPIIIIGESALYGTAGQYIFESIIFYESTKKETS